MIILGDIEHLLSVFVSSRTILAMSCAHESSPIPNPVFSRKIA